VHDVKRYFHNVLTSIFLTSFDRQGKRSIFRLFYGDFHSLEVCTRLIFRLLTSLHEHKHDCFRFLSRNYLNDKQ